MNKLKKPSKGNQYKLTSGIYIVFVVVILLLINLIANLFSVKFDFSANKAFSLSDEGKSALDTITRDIEILVCSDRAAYNGNIYLTNIAETIESMDDHSDYVTATFKSVDKNPEIKDDYPTTGLSTSSIIIRLADDYSKYRVVDANNLLERNTDTGAVTESKVEYLIISAMDYVCRDTFPAVQFVSNHVEDYPSAFASLLIGNNYNVGQINLLTDEITEEAEYIMICNPKTDYSPDEIKKLDAFLQNDGELGRNIFVFMSPEQPSLPNLEAFLSEWGIEVQPGYLYNTTHSVDNTYEPMVTAFSDVQSAGNLFQTVQVITYQTRPLNLLFATREYQTTTSLLTTASGTQHVKDSDSDKDPSNDPPSNAPVVAVGTRIIKNSSSESHIVVSGSYKLISDEYINSTYGNNEYIMQLINYFGEDEGNFIIYPKNMESAILSFSSSSTKTVLFIVFIIAIPAVIAVTGLSVFLKRRHL